MVAGGTGKRFPSVPLIETGSDGRTIFYVSVVGQTSSDFADSRIYRLECEMGQLPECLLGGGPQECKPVCKGTLKYPDPLTKLPQVYKWTFPAKTNDLSAASNIADLKQGSSLVFGLANTIYFGEPPAPTERKAVIKPACDHAPRRCRLLLC